MLFASLQKVIFALKMNHTCKNAKILLLSSHQKIYSLVFEYLCLSVIQAYFLFSQPQIGLNRASQIFMKIPILAYPFGCHQKGPTLC